MVDEVVPRIHNVALPIGWVVPQTHSAGLIANRLSDMLDQPRYNVSYMSFFFNLNESFSLKAPDEVNAQGGVGLKVFCRSRPLA